MTILSIDPSIENIGVAEVDGRRLIRSYTLHTKPSQSIPDRVKDISAHFRGLDGEYEKVLIEYPDTFMRMGDYRIKNVRSVQLLMLSIGVIMAALIDRYEIVPITVNEWKGKSDKKITQFIAKSECGEDLNSHEADAYVMAVRWNKVIKFKHFVRKAIDEQEKRNTRSSKKGKRARRR